MCIVFAAVGLDNLITCLLKKFGNRGLVALQGSLVCLRTVARALSCPIFGFHAAAGSLGRQ